MKEKQVNKFKLYKKITLDKKYKVIFSLIIGIVIGSCISTYAAYNYLANEIGYTKKDGTTINVEQALNELYSAKKENETYICKDGVINSHLIGQFEMTAYNSYGGNNSNEGIPTKPTITFGDKNINVSLTSTTSALVGELCSVKSIDVTNFNKLKMHVIDASVYLNGYAYQYINFGMLKQKNNYFTMEKGSNIVSQNGNSKEETLGNQIITVDISDLKGEYYFYIYERNNGTLTFDDIWFE